MPGRDRTGPDRYGPLTGRSLGLCRGGLRRGFGRRLGFRRYLDQISLTKEEQKRILEEELKYIETEKKDIEKRLKEIESGKKWHDQDVAEE
ncbi:MAG: DUF5320 domain-containing protein [Promethearchaeota archaeon]